MYSSGEEIELPTQDSNSTELIYQLRKREPASCGVKSIVQGETANQQN